MSMNYQSELFKSPTFVLIHLVILYCLVIFDFRIPIIPLLSSSFSPNKPKKKTNKKNERTFFWVWWGFGSIGEKWFVCVQLFFGL